MEGIDGCHFSRRYKEKKGGSGYQWLHLGRNGRETSLTFWVKEEKLGQLSWALNLISINSLGQAADSFF